MLEGLAIGAGIGLVGVLTVVTVGYVLNYRLVGETHQANDERRVAEELAKNEAAKIATLDANVTSLKGEISILKATNDMLTAQLSAVQKEADDLLHAIQTSEPSALPSVLRAQLDRLRAKAVPPTIVAPAPGDPSGGKESALHVAPSGDKPTG